MIQKLIEEALADYQEPEHKGTARGEPVGFSRKKMESSGAYDLDWLYGARR